MGYSLAPAYKDVEFVISPSGPIVVMPFAVEVSAWISGECTECGETFIVVLRDQAAADTSVEAKAALVSWATRKREEHVCG